MRVRLLDPRVRPLRAWARRSLTGSVAAFAFAFAAACDSSSDPITVADADISRDGGLDGGSLTVTPDALAFTRAVPDRGPWRGGNTVILRGQGFEPTARVFFGDLLVQPADTCPMDGPACDPFRLTVRPPEGAAGVVAITVELGEEGSAGFQRIVAPGAYTYEDFVVEPNQGSTAGGTLLRLTGKGTAFGAGDTVTVGGAPCTNLVVQTPTTLTCRAPAGEAGQADVVVTDDGVELLAEDAFLYRDAASADEGGLGGGPIEGTLNVTVVNAQTGAREPDVYVVVGEDLTTDWQGFTDPTGQVVFSGPELVGPVRVHASKDCFERTSFLSFDARDVTILLVPWDPNALPPGHRCLPPPTPGPPPPGGPGRLGTVLSGTLRWLGANEFGRNSWDNIPEPSRGYERVAYVYTTQVCEGGSENCRNPFTMVDPFDPAAGFITRVAERDRPPSGSLGWPYTIFARPGSYAVWAIAGLEKPGEGTDPFTGLPAPGDFIPYVMGVARDVIGGPGETVTGIEVIMDIPLDATLDIDLAGLPERLPNGPTTYRARAFIDLGAEGFISRTPGDVLVNFGGFFLFLDNLYLGELPDGLDTVQSLVRKPLRFWAQPALTGALADARYRITVGWYTDAVDELGCGQTTGHMPCTERVLTSVQDTRGVLTVVGEGDAFLGMPRAVSPASPGGTLGADRVLRWSLGDAKPDFQIVLVTGSDNLPAWRMIVEGTAQEAQMPDLRSIPTLLDLPAGEMRWVVLAARKDGACPRSADCPEGVNSFNEWTYRDATTRLWSHTSANVFSATVPAQ